MTVSTLSPNDIAYFRQRIEELEARCARLEANRIQVRTRLSELDDVSQPTADKQVMRYVQSAGMWVPATIGSF